jgi:hypothetical protein
MATITVDEEALVQAIASETEDFFEFTEYGTTATLEGRSIAIRAVLRAQAPQEHRPTAPSSTEPFPPS